jgi:predicted RNase H-like HicB family nuclease
MKYILRLTSAPWELQAMDLTVRAAWDAQASVWVAESDDVPGLITEADDLETLMSKLRVMIPELLEANDALPPNVDELPFRLIILDRAYRLAA